MPLPRYSLLTNTPKMAHRSTKKNFDSVSFEDKDNWEDPIWGLKGDRTEKVYAPVRDATLTINYFDSEDGVCRTAFSSVSNQVHEFREHSAENAWKFISQFRRG